MTTPAPERAARPRRRPGPPADLLFGLTATLVFAAYAVHRIAQDSFVLGGTRYYNVLDDALISMRYGWNLAHGAGLVWNPGEYVEGYSNPLQVGICALLALVADKTHAVLALQVLGAAWVVSCAWLARGLSLDLARRTDPETPGSHAAAALVLVATLFYYPLFSWSLYGMETGLLTALLLLACRAALSPGAAGGRATRVSLLLSLAYLCRPDAALPATLLFAWLVFAAGRHERLRVAVSAGLPFAGVVALHLVLRKLYYDAWLPNTYQLKLAGVPASDRIADGAAFLGLYLRETWPLLALGALGPLLGRRREHVLLAALFVAGVGYYVWAGGDFVPDLWRFLVPGMPMLFVLAVDGARRCSVLLRVPRNALALWAPLAVVVLAVGHASQRYAPRWVADFEKRSRQSENDVRSARAIESLTTPDAVVGVFTAGSIPYYSGRPAVDFLGKMDPVIARTPPHRDVVPGMTRLGARMWPGHSKYDLAYSIGRLQPDVVKRLVWFDDDLRARVADAYVPLNLGPVALHLKRGSPRIRWERLACSDRGCRLRATGAQPDHG